MTDKSNGRDAPSRRFAERMELLWKREEFSPETIMDLALMRECIREQQAALEFYANERNWDMQYDHVPYGSTTASMPTGTCIDDDGGATASAVLSKWRIE